MRYTFHEFILVDDENSNNITYNHLLIILPFYFFSQLGFVSVQRVHDAREKGSIEVHLKRKDLKNKMAFNIQGDWTIRSLKLSNRHMSFSWPIG